MGVQSRSPVGRERLCAFESKYQQALCGTEENDSKIFMEIKNPKNFTEVQKAESSQNIFLIFDCGRVCVTEVAS